MGLLKRIAQITRAQIGTILRDRATTKSQQQGHQRVAEEGSASEPFRPSPQPENSKEKEYYAYLELSPGADFPAVKKAHRKLLKKYHPDLHSGDAGKQEIAQEICVHLNEALEYFEKKFKLAR